MANLFDTRKAEEVMRINEAAMRGNVNEYLEWNLSVFQIKKNKNILDLGCGPGAYFNEIMRYEPSLYFSTDYSNNFLDEVKKFFNDRPNCIAAKFDIMDEGALDLLKGYKFDYVLCFDVLEHIENDRKALMNIHKIISNTGYGKLCLRIPAIQFIYGENDRAIGHYRRYYLKSLKKLLEECSFNVEKIRYQNIIGIVPWYIVGNILKRSIAVSGSEVKLFSRMVPIIKSIENLFIPPVGLSVYCVCSVRN